MIHQHDATQRRMAQPMPVGCLGSDPASSIFGRHSREPDPGIISLALGSLRGFPPLTHPGTQGSMDLLEALAELYERERLRALAVEHGALLIVDDLYRFTVPCTGRDLEGPDVVLVDSFSKRFGAPGLRLGYAKGFGPRLAQARASMGRTSVGVSVLAATVGERAVKYYLPRPAIADEIRSGLAERRHAVRSALHHEAQ